MEPGFLMTICTCDREGIEDVGVGVPQSAYPALRAQCRKPHPVYDRDGVRLYVGDCLEVLPTLDQVDHVITDPPYSPRAMKNYRSANMIQRRDGQIKDFGYAGITDALRSAVLHESARLARRWVLIWTDIESAHLWREGGQEHGLRYIRTGVWVREHGAPQFSGDRPAQGVEACYIGHAAASKLKWNGGGHPAYWIGPIVNSQAEQQRIHSSPKPLWLMLQLIEDFTNPGETILDSFGGSMTTAVACKMLGRKCIAIEKEERWVKVGIKRLDATPVPLFVTSVQAIERGQAALPLEVGT